MNNFHNYKVITITHKDTHLNEIGKFVLPNSDNDEIVQHRLNQVKHGLHLQELMYLATCNRIMFFFVSEADLDKDILNTFFNLTYAHLPVETRQLGKETAIKLQGNAAIQHIFEVASSMNSMVIGEREILRQLREAYKRNLNLGLTGDSLRLAMRYAVETAKRVYSGTKIGEKPVSVVSLAIQKLLSAKLPLDARILLIGAGQTNRLVVKLLQKHGYKNFVVFNRSLAKAQALVDTMNGTAYPLDQLATYTDGFDVMVAATGATSAIVTAELYAQLLGGDQEHKMLIDLSIPNNIASCIEIEHNATYIPIESLKELADRNIAFREKEVGKAREIVYDYMQIFAEAFRERQIERALHQVPIQIKAIRHHAINNVFKKEVADLDEDSKELIDRMMAYMEKRCIAIPIQVAKQKLLKQ